MAATSKVSFLVELRGGDFRTTPVLVIVSETESIGDVIATARIIACTRKLKPLYISSHKGVYAAKMTVRNKEFELPYATAVGDIRLFDLKQPFDLVCAVIDDEEEEEEEEQKAKSDSVNGSPPTKGI